MMIRSLLLTLFLVATCCGHLKWWQETVVYQIYPRSFKDSDADGVGDLEGIRSKLDYIQSLGVKTVWLSPIFPSPDADFGYDVSDYEDINPLYGDMASFDQLLEDIHSRDMFLLLDFVPNHSSDQHQWFIESRKSKDNPYSDYYIWKDPADINDPKPPNNWLSVFGGSAWEYVPERQQYYLHQFVKGQPDLNYRNPKVVEEMQNVLRFWLDKGVDGFRCDAPDHIFEDEQFRNEPLLDSDHPDQWSSYDHIYTKYSPDNYEIMYQFKLAVREYEYVARNRPERVLIVESDRLEWFGTAEKEGANLPFNFDLLQLNGDSKSVDFVNIVKRYLSRVPRGKWTNWVIGNHDNRRVASRFGVEKIDIMNTVNLLLPGLATTYMGEEIGMEDNTDITYKQGLDPQGCNAGPDRYADVTRDFERSPFQWDNTTNAGFSEVEDGGTWLPVNNNYLDLNVAAQNNSENSSHLSFYREIVQLRDLPVVRDGDIYIRNKGDNVLAFIREKPASGNLTVVINLGDTLEVVNLRDMFPGRQLQWYIFNTKSPNTNYTYEYFLDPTNVTLPEYACVIFTQ